MLLNIPVPRMGSDREGSGPSVDWAEGETLAKPDSTPVVINQLRVHSSLAPCEALQSLSSSPF